MSQKTKERVTAVEAEVKNMKREWSEVIIGNRFDPKDDGLVGQVGCVERRLDGLGELLERLSSRVIALEPVIDGEPHDEEAMSRLKDANPVPDIDPDPRVPDEEAAIRTDLEGPGERTLWWFENQFWVKSYHSGVAGHGDVTLSQGDDPKPMRWPKDSDGQSMAGWTHLRPAKTFEPDGVEYVESGRGWVNDAEWLVREGLSEVHPRTNWCDRYCYEVIPVEEARRRCGLDEPGPENPVVEVTELEPDDSPLALLLAQSRADSAERHARRVEEIAETWQDIALGFLEGMRLIAAGRSMDPVATATRAIRAAGYDPDTTTEVEDKA